MTSYCQAPSLPASCANICRDQGPGTRGEPSDDPSINTEHCWARSQSAVELQTNVREDFTITNTSLGILELDSSWGGWDSGALLPSLCDTFNVSNEYKSRLRPGDLLAHPRILPPWHYTFCQHLNMGPGMIETTTRQQSEVKLERRFAWMLAGERRRAGVPTDIIPLTRLLIADISVRPRHYCQWTHQRQCCQQQRRRGHCHANTRSISCSCADLVLIQIPSTVTTGSRLRRTLRVIKTAIIPL